MAPKSLPLDQIEETLRVFEETGGVVAETARRLGITRSSVDNRLRRAEAVGARPTPKRPSDFEIPDLPDETLPVEDIIDRRLKLFGRRQKAAAARHLIHIPVKLDGPIGIAVFGDIHIDNPGSNFPLLKQHTDLVKNTEGLFAGAVGDLQDSWVGRLARLWAQQGVTAREAWRLVEWWVAELAGKLIWITEGNHDAWALGVNGISPVEWIAARQGTVSEADGVRISLDLPSGKSFVINCRHDMRGRSQYNAAHGVTKAAMFGWRDDILLAGHTHQFGYNPIKDPMTGRVSHPVRVASYKHLDHYASERGFPDENISECPVIIFDIDNPDPRHHITVDFNPARAAKVLDMLRAEWKAKKAKR